MRNKTKTTWLLAGVLLVWMAGGTSLAAQDSGATYKSKCAMCHGADGKGDTPMAKRLGVRSFSSPEVQKESDAELIQITTDGKNKMPGYGKSLKETEIKGLVAYIRELAKK
ncbi:MAG TPA: cytochrome c [Terriglobales bacterium]|nr:cytochrome c [Terriglobales bacterium]